MMERGGSAVLRPEGKGFEVEMCGKSSLIAILSLLLSLASRKCAIGIFGRGEWVEASNSYM